MKTNRWAIVWKDGHFTYLSGDYNSASEVRVNCLLDRAVKVVYIPETEYHPCSDGEHE